VLNAAIKDPKLPEQPGPFQVATTRLLLTDESREDPWSDDPEKRRIMLQIWYPIANGSSTVDAKYLPPAAAVYMDNKMHVPKGTVNQLKTYSFQGGKPINPLVTKDGVLPVVVFSPGSGTIVAEYTTFNAPLASYGYIVVGMDHLYDSAPVEVPDGTLVIGDLGDRNHTKNAIATGYRRDDAMYVAKQISSETLAKWIPEWTPAAETPIKSFKLGIYGQSLGGSTASLALQDSSSPYKAGLSFDGPFYGEIVEKGLDGPFVFISAQDSETHDSLKSEWPKIRGWKRALTLKGTTHYDYSDLNSLVPQAPGTLLNIMYGPKMGPIGPKRRTNILAAYLNAFFDYSLRGSPVADFLDKASPKYPEMLFDQQ